MQNVSSKPPRHKFHKTEEKYSKSGKCFVKKIRKISKLDFDTTELKRKRKLIQTNFLISCLFT